MAAPLTKSDLAALKAAVEQLEPKAPKKSGKSTAYYYVR